jgi:hypothetical protein
LKRGSQPLSIAFLVLSYSLFSTTLILRQLLATLKGSMMKFAIAHAIFAVIATLANIVAQDILVRGYNGAFGQNRL